MTGRFIRKTFVEHRREIIEKSQNCKYFDEFVDIQNMQKRPQAPTPIFLGLESEKSENQVPSFKIFENNLKFTH